MTSTLIVGAALLFRPTKGLSQLIGHKTDARSLVDHARLDACQAYGEMRSAKRSRKDGEVELISSWKCRLCATENSQVTYSCRTCGLAKRDCDGGEKAFGTRLRSQQEATSGFDSPPVGSVSVDFKKKGTPPKLPDRLSVLSFNVAGLLPSAAAPSKHWNPVPTFRSQILSLDPDVVCLQEIPEAEADGFLPGYVCVGTSPSHCEHVALFFKEAWAAHNVCISGVGAPAVLAATSFSVRDNMRKAIVFGSCHLAPFKTNASARMEQVRTILGATPTDTLVLAGDFNMRVAEDKQAESLGLRDAWKEAGAHTKEKNTWNSKDQTPRGAPRGSGPHNQYHGPDAFQFACRFDRIYLRGDDLSVKSFQLFADKSLTNPFHFLSDHFGMLTTLQCS